MGRFVEWSPRAERSYEGRPHARHITTAVRVLVLALYAHGYLEVNGKVFDVSSVDPSMASAAGAHALITTGGDLVRFLDALLAGRLFRRHETLRQMLTFAYSPDVCGHVGYGHGLERRVLPGGIELIGHLGGAGGYYAYVGRMPRRQVTFAAAMNSSADPSPPLPHISDSRRRTLNMGTNGSFGS